MVKIGSVGSQYDPMLDNVACNCASLPAEPVKRRLNEPERCSAVTRRGNGKVGCRNNVLRTVEHHGGLCKEHVNLLRAHRICAHCAMFTDWAHRIVCCSDGHLTHTHCSRKFSPEGKFLCSHCNKEAEPKEFISKEFLVPSERNGLVRPKELTSWDDWKIRMDELISRSDFEGAVREIRCINDCHIDGVVPLSIVYEAIDYCAIPVLEELRSIGATISYKVLYDKVQWMNMEMLRALQVNELFGSEFLNSKVYGETILMKAARLGLWSQFKSLLEMFDQTGVDVSITSDFNGMSLGAICEAAPSTADAAKHALCKAAQRLEFTKRLGSGKKNIIIEDLANGSERFPVRVVNDVDDTMPDTFVYVTRVRDTCSILRNRKPVELLNCWCKDRCSSNCTCCSNVYDSSGRIQIKDVDVAFIECSSDCMCSMRCGNRIAQKGATIPIEIFKSNNGRGWGVRALADIKPGSFIGEYTGDLITEQAAESRIDNYFFETNVGEESYTIDAFLNGNFTRFINHSCQPNARVALVIWDWHAEQLNHLCVFSSERINKGDEITISYGEHWWNSKISEMHCRCGSAACKFSSTHRDHYLREHGSTGSPSCSSDDSTP